MAFCSPRAAGLRSALTRRRHGQSEYGGRRKLRILSENAVWKDRRRRAEGWWDKVGRV